MVEGPEEDEAAIDAEAPSEGDDGGRLGVDGTWLACATAPRRATVTVAGARGNGEAPGGRELLEDGWGCAGVLESGAEVVRRAPRSSTSEYSPLMSFQFFFCRFRLFAPIFFATALPSLPSFRPPRVLACAAVCLLFSLYTLSFLYLGPSPATSAPCPSPPRHTALPGAVLDQIAAFRGQAIKDKLANPNNNANDNHFRSRRKRGLYPLIASASDHIDPPNIELVIVLAVSKSEIPFSMEEVLSAVVGPKGDPVDRFVLDRLADVDERASSVLAPMVGVAETQGYYVFSEEGSGACAGAAFFEAVAAAFRVFEGPVLGVVQADGVSSDALRAFLARKRSRATVTVLAIKGALGVAIPSSLLSLWPKSVRASLADNRDRMITMYDVSNTLSSVAGSSVLTAGGYSILDKIPARTCEAALVPLASCKDPLLRWGPSDDPVALFEADAVVQELKSESGGGGEWTITEASLAARQGDSKETARVRFKTANPNKTCFGRLEEGKVKEKGCV
jgi:hypothetical protein